MITFNELTKRLKKINKKYSFSNKIPLIKFTFDIGKALKQVNRNKNFSETTICDFDKNNFIMQNQVYRILIMNYKEDNKQITDAFERGFCTLCAIYNSFPFVFNEDINQVSEFIHNNLKKDMFANVKYVTTKLNELNNVSLFYT